MTRFNDVVDGALLRAGGGGLRDGGSATAAHRRQQLLQQPHRRLELRQQRDAAARPAERADLHAGERQHLLRAWAASSMSPAKLASSGTGKTSARPWAAGACPPARTWCCRSSGPSTVRDTAALPVDYEGGLISNVDNIPLRNSLYATATGGCPCRPAEGRPHARPDGTGQVFASRATSSCNGGATTSTTATRRTANSAASAARAYTALGNLAHRNRP